MLFLLTLFGMATVADAQEHKMFCRVSGPDSVYFDKTTYNRYLPGSFDIDIMLMNYGTTDIDSVVVFPRSNPRFTVLPPATRLVSARLHPDDTVYTSFTLNVNPRAVSGFDTVIVAVTGKGGARSNCQLVIWVEKEYRPVNEIICPPAGSVSTVFVDSLNSYVPNPVQLTLLLRNNGDAPSKDTRMLYIATEGVSPAEGQLPVVDLGTLDAGGERQLAFALQIVPRDNDTTVLLPFRLQGYGGLGDRIIDTICYYELFIPRAREVYFALECESDPGIRYEDGAYVPNPFTWSVTIRNTGNARARNVRALISLPEAYVLEGGSQEQALGDLEPGIQRNVEWMVRARPVFEPDTSEICVRAFDAFNRIASCCDTVTLPSVRAPSLEGDCSILPDTIRVDTQTGLYLPQECTVSLGAHNVGSDPADSVWAEIVITDPDFEFVSPSQGRQMMALSIPPAGHASAQWTLRPLPVATPRDLTITARISSRNAATVVTRCTMHIEAALKPELQCSASTTPGDTLHFNSSSLEYDALTLRAAVQNMGSVAARDVQATILLPPNISLQPGEANVQYLGDPLEHNGSWVVEWKLLPLKRREGSLNDIEVEFRTAGSAALSTYCSDWIFLVGIPPITVFSIPHNFVVRHGNEVTIPLRIDEAENKNITELQLAVRYDAEKLDFLGFIRDSLLLDRPWDVVSTSVPGTASFTAQHPDGSLSGSGALLNMHFRVRFGLTPDQLRWADVPLTFDSLRSSVNRGSVLARFYNGGVIVSGDCLYPLEAGENFVIIQGAPNPFNPVTLLHVHASSSGNATVDVYDLYGRHMARLHDGLLDAGEHRFRLDASSWPSGVYHAVVRTRGGFDSYRLLLTK